MSDLLQSEGWERFQHALGRKTERIDGVLAIEMPLPFGMSYLYSPHGTFPIGHCEELEGRRGNPGEVFWRVECSSQPEIPDSRFQIPRVLRHSLEPEWTWRTSLDGTDDVLLARMHEKHRYNIRLATKRVVVVRVSSPPLPPLSSERRGEAQGGEADLYDFDSYWLLFQETARRQKISTHPRRYYETMLRELPRTAVYLAEHEGAAIACAIVARHGDTATYLHGGSSHAHRAFMAPHLLHWQAMRDARDVGMHWYEWGGIAPPGAEEHRWDGMTRFKRGFGGEAIHHAPTRDLVFRPGWYRMLAWLAAVRR